MDRRALFTTLRIALIVSAWAGALGPAIHSATAQVTTLSEEAKGGLQAKGAQSENALSRDDVIQLQKLLTALGYPTGPTDGVAGPKTHAAIRQFQVDHEEPVTGIASRELLGSVSGAYIRMLADQLVPPDQAEAAWALLQQRFDDLPEDLVERATGGDADSQYELAQFWLDMRSEIERKKMPSEIATALLNAAVELLRFAAEQGHAQAQFEFGYINDLAGEYIEAIKWYRQAAEGGNLKAAGNLARLYLLGHSVPQDYGEAAKWLRKAAEGGDPWAAGQLGHLLYEGRGVIQDYAEAMNWFREAVKTDRGDAQNYLGIAYLEGKGVPRDYQEAVRWFRKAAEQGEAKAQVNLGVRYHNGEGVPQDYLQAYMWLNLAAANLLPGSLRDNAVQARDQVAARLTPAQVADAQRMAREWLERHRTGVQQ